MTEFLTPGEVAALLRRDVRTLANWRYLGVGPAYVKTGRILYARRDVDAWIATATRIAR